MCVCVVTAIEEATQGNQYDVSSAQGYLLCTRGIHVEQLFSWLSQGLPWMGDAQKITSICFSYLWPSTGISHLQAKGIAKIIRKD